MVGGFRDICMAPETFLYLHPGLVTWVHHGNRTHVWDSVWACHRVQQVL